MTDRSVLLRVEISPFLGLEELSPDGERRLVPAEAPENVGRPTSLLKPAPRSQMWRLRHQIEAISAGRNQSVALDRLRARAPIEVQLHPLAQAAWRQCFSMSDRLLQMCYRVAYT